MDRVEEIEAAIERLPPDEYRRLIERLRELEQSRWDAQMDEDSATGKMDEIFEQADAERAAGTLRDWPPVQ